MCSSVWEVAPQNFEENSFNRFAPQDVNFFEMEKVLGKLLPSPSASGCWKMPLFCCGITSWNDLWQNEFAAKALFHGRSKVSEIVARRNLDVFVWLLVDIGSRMDSNLFQYLVVSTVNQSRISDL